MILCAFIAGVGVAMAQPAAISNAAARLGLDADAVQRIQQGEIVTRDQDPSGKREIAAAGAVLIHAPVARVRELFTGGEIFRAGSNVAAALPDRDAKPDDFGPIALDDRDLPEVHALLHAKPGEALNLTAEEAARFAALRKQVKGPEDEQDALQTRLANEELRRVLAERFNAYRQGGLSAVAPYARGQGRTRAGDDLAGAASADRALGPEFEGLRDAAQRPQAPAAGVERRFFALKDRVELRPEFVLVGLLSAQQGGAWAFVEQQFYVSQSYNAAEITGLALPCDQQTVVFYSVRTSTDRLTGFGEDARRKIAQARLRDDAADFLRTLREHAEKPAPADH
jgi:hypothetical protein